MRIDPGRAHLVFLRSGEVVMTRRVYADWREIQDELDGFMTSLGPWTEDELTGFLENQYGADEARWPFTRADVAAFMRSDLVARRSAGER